MSIEEMVGSGVIPDIIGGAALRRRIPTPSIAGAVDRIYRGVSKTMKKNKKKKKKTDDIKK